MKTAIIFSDGIKQINFTPENNNERQALKLITPNDDIRLAVKNGTFGVNTHKPYTIEISECRGGFLRAFDNDESVMLVLLPQEKPSEKERVYTESQISELQSAVHKITGDGEVMQLFNSLLGISAVLS